MSPLFIGINFLEVLYFLPFLFFWSVSILLPTFCIMSIVYHQHCLISKYYYLLPKFFQWVLFIFNVFPANTVYHQHFYSEYYFMSMIFGFVFIELFPADFDVHHRLFLASFFSCSYSCKLLSSSWQPPLALPCCVMTIFCSPTFFVLQPCTLWPILISFTHAIMF